MRHGAALKVLLTRGTMRPMGAGRSRLLLSFTCSTAIHLAAPALAILFWAAVAASSKPKDVNPPSTDELHADLERVLTGGLARQTTRSQGIPGIHQAAPLAKTAQLEIKLVRLPPSAFTAVAVHDPANKMAQDPKARVEQLTSNQPQQQAHLPRQSEGLQRTTARGVDSSLPSRPADAQRRTTGSDAPLRKASAPAPHRPQQSAHASQRATLAHLMQRQTVSATATESAVLNLKKTEEGERVSSKSPGAIPERNDASERFKRDAVEPRPSSVHQLWLAWEEQRAPDYLPLRSAAPLAIVEAQLLRPAEAGVLVAPLFLARAGGEVDAAAGAASAGADATAPQAAADAATVLSDRPGASEAMASPGSSAIPAGGGAGLLPGTGDLALGDPNEMLVVARISEVASLFIGDKTLRQKGGREAKIRFRIDGNGYVQDFELYQPTGVREFDGAIEAILHLAEPFPVASEVFDISLPFFGAKSS